ncbi:MAG: hypothetical protein IJO87_03760 [Eggerthellaceae bacterium]|nr:hypothetical protein [Eggerthellaceae bacterium]
MNANKRKDVKQHHIRHEAPYNVIDEQHHLGNNLSTGSGNARLRSPSSADAILRHELKDPMTSPLSEFDAATSASPYLDVRPEHEGTPSYAMIEFGAPRRENPTSGVSFIPPYQKDEPHPEPPQLG